MKYKTGDRVLFLDDLPAYAFHSASLGDGRYMHLNAKDETGKVKPITGTILKFRFTDQEKMDYYSFQPDGWPADAKNIGFTVQENWFSPLTDPNLSLPGTLTDGVGRPLL